MRSGCGSRPRCILLPDTLRSSVGHLAKWFSLSDAYRARGSDLAISDLNRGGFACPFAAENEQLMSSRIHIVNVHVENDVFCVFCLFAANTPPFPLPMLHVWPEL